MSQPAVKYGFIFRYIYGVIGLVATVAVTMIAFIYLAQRADLEAQRRVTFFHLESQAIAEELRDDNRSLLRLLGDGASGVYGIAPGGSEGIRRGPDSLGTLQMLDAKVNELHRLDQQYESTEFDATLNRIRDRFRSVEQSIRHHNPAALSRQALLSFDLAVEQLQRQHAVAVERIGPDVVSVIERTRPYPTIIVAILMTAGIVTWITMRLLHNAIKRQTEAERTLAENIEKMHHLEKLESIGRLVGGVAHDFNNLLTAILGQTGLLLEQAADERTRYGLTQIREAGQQAASLTRQLLDYTRPKPAGMQVVDVNELVQGIEGIVTRVIGSEIDLTIDYGKDLAPVNLDPARLQQLIVNLAVNARDAMPDGGKLTIATETVAVATGGHDPDEGPAERYTRISVSDTGIGMDKETIGRIFEPYFTTKPMGRGTGLGLSVVYGIVKGAGGYIDVHSSPGKGSRFDAVLPASTERPTISSPVRGSVADTLTRETVLVVEDDQSIRTFLKEGLEMLGYQVFIAADADEGMDICTGNQGQIDVILSDVILPGKNGVEFVRAARKPQPNAMVVLMSGYTDDILSHIGVGESDMPLLHKPFEINELVSLIRKGRSTESVA